MPNTRFVLDAPDYSTKSLGHPDHEDWIEGVNEARHKYDSESENVRWFEVDDSAEGWVKVVEILETAAYQEKHKDKLFIFDFSKVRQSGSPIAGQQGRPASGPVPFIKALSKVATIKGLGMKPWKQALFIDHYLSSCVAVGGVRRSARIAVKSWRDRDIFDYIDIKRGGWLYTANNSVGVDAEFWEQARSPKPSHGRRVFEAMISAAYFDRTGEPGFLNLDKLAANDHGIEKLTGANVLSAKTSDLLKLHPNTSKMVGDLLKLAVQKKYHYIVNPCSEILLMISGGYCVIGDLCLANAVSRTEAIDAARLMTQFLIRTNTMTALYEAEVKRTNRIGVGITGVHEFAYSMFGLSFHDLLDETKSHEFWGLIQDMRITVEREGRRYSKAIGVSVPHTFCCAKPSGTISKVMACTEGVHLPAYDYYMRWVQYSTDAHEVQEHVDRGYPMKDISQQYPGHVVIGFPTKMSITDIMGDAVVVAGDVSPEDQYKWLQLLEKYWLGDGNNQISYTLKYNPDKVSYTEFMQTILNYQDTVRCCAVMPQEEESAYIYLPEERISKETYETVVSRINNRFQAEAYDEEALQCASGACPI